MLDVRVENNIEQVIKRLNRYERVVVPKSLSRSMFQVTKRAKEKVKQSAPRFLHNPRPSTINTIRNFAPQARDVYTLPARVHVLNVLTDNLAPIIFGGTVTSLNESVIVAPINIETNQYGNIRGMRDAGRGNILERMRLNVIDTRDYFEVPLGSEGLFNGLPAGIYESLGAGELSMQVAYYRQRTYQAIWPFDRIVGNVYRAEFADLFFADLKAAIKRQQRQVILGR